MRHTCLTGLLVMLSLVAFPVSPQLTSAAGPAERTGDWFIGVSTGTAFVVEPWSHSFGTRGAGEEIFGGDFTGDGKADVAIHDKQTGDWFVGVSTGIAFVVEPWAHGFGTRGPGVEKIFVADFTGDGRADIAIHDRQTGNWFVGRSTGNSFAIETWATGFGTRGPGVEEIFVADFTGDGRTDVAIHDKQTGDWFVGASTGSSFAIELWDTGFGFKSAKRFQIKLERGPTPHERFG